MSVIAEFYALIKGDSSQLQGELAKTKTALGSTGGEVQRLSSISVLSFAAMAGAAYKVGKTFVDLASDAMKYALQVKDMARITGDTVQETSMLIQAADDARITYDELTAAMRLAVKQGIDPSLEGMMKLADQYNAIQDPIERDQFLLDTFGRAGLKMGRMMEMGSAGIKASADEAERLGLVLDGMDIESAQRYFTSLDTAKDSVEGLKIALGTDLIPIFTEVVNTVNAAYENFSALSDQFWKLKDYAEQSVPALSLLMDAFLLFANPIQGVIELIDDFKRELVFLGIITPEAAGFVDSLGNSMDGVAESTTNANAQLGQANSFINALHDKQVTVTINTIHNDSYESGNNISPLDPGSGFAGSATGGGWASGGYAGGGILVGERGPEVITKSAHGYIAPNETANINLSDKSIRDLSKAIVDGMIMVRA
jgi:hypothetical protein